MAINRDLGNFPKEALIRAMQDSYYAEQIGVPAVSAMFALQERTAQEKAAAQQMAMMQGQQAQQAPSVAEQVVNDARMTGGLGTLPAPNVGAPEAFANGGIVAFNERGEVPDLDDIRRKIQERRKKEAAEAYWGEQERAANERGVYGAVLGDALGEIADIPSGLRRWLTGGVLGDKPPVPEAPLAAQEYVDRLKQQGVPTREVPNAPVAPAAVASPYLPSFTPEVAPAAPAITELPVAGAGVGGRGAGAVSRGTGAGPQGIAALPAPNLAWTDMPYQDFSDVKETETPAAEYAQQMRDMMGVDPTRAAQAERLAKMDAAAAKSAETDPWMALAQAGFAIAGGKSPHAITNIGEGAMVGIEQLNKYRDKALAAEEKRFDLAQKLADKMREEDLIAAKYGAESAQAQKARMQTQKLAEKTSRASVDATNAKGRFDALQGNAEIGLKREELASRERQHSETVAATREGYKRYGDAADKELIRQRTALLNNALDEARASLDNLRKNMGSPEEIAAAQANYNNILKQLAQVAQIDLPTAHTASPAGFKLLGIKPQ